MKPTIFGPFARPIDPAGDARGPERVALGDDPVAVDDELGDEADLVSGARGQQLDVELLADLDPRLLATGVNHCVHR